MEINFWKPTVSAGVVKATIHRSGKLGFSQAAINKLNIDQNSYVMIGTNKLQRDDRAIYLRIASEANELTLKVSKAGQYYYLNSKDFFNENNIDFNKKKIIYDIIDISEGSEKLYKLIPREKERKKK
ncbi:MAG: hypothetical protein ACW990_18285 [Promethearchaeota archaeon]|jgi:hypothetical protein